MYKIIGADQREYGPVSADQMREWIAEGRANGETQTRAEGVGEWKPLAQFPEFAAALAAKSATTPLPPITDRQASPVATDPLARHPRLDISDCFSRSWALLKDNLNLLVGANAVILLVLIGLWFVPLLGHVAGLLFAFVLLAGLDLVFLKRIRGEPTDAAQAFAGFSDRFVPLLLGSIVASILTGIGLLACAVPGIYLLTAWWLFVPLLIIDKGLDFWAAMEASRKAVNRNWWPCFGLFLLAGLISALGVFFFVVGVFLTMPLAVGAKVYAYEDLFATRAEAIAPPMAGAVPTPAGTLESVASATPGEPSAPADQS